jgi:hypothetical protein
VAEETLRLWTVNDCGSNLPSNLLDGFTNIIRDFLIHRTVLLGVCEALATELLLSSVKAFIHVVAAIAAAGISCWSGVHDEKFVSCVLRLVVVMGLEWGSRGR